MMLYVPNRFKRSYPKHSNLLTRYSMTDIIYSQRNYEHFNTRECNRAVDRTGHQSNLYFLNNLYRGKRFVYRYGYNNRPMVSELFQWTNV